MVLSVSNVETLQLQVWVLGAVVSVAFTIIFAIISYVGRTESKFKKEIKDDVAKLHKRISDNRSDVDARIDKMNEKVNDTNNKVDVLQNEVANQTKIYEQGHDNLEEKIDGLDKKMDQLMDVLKG